MVLETEEGRASGKVVPQRAMNAGWASRHGKPRAPGTTESIPILEFLSCLKNIAFTFLLILAGWVTSAAIEFAHNAAFIPQPLVRRLRAQQAQ